MLKCLASDAFHTNCRLDKALKPKRRSIYINGCELSEEGSGTSGRPFAEGVAEGCEVTGWLYFISALLVLFLTIIFLHVSYLTWPFFSGLITYHFGSLLATLIYPPFIPLLYVIFLSACAFFSTSEIAVENATLKYDNSLLCLQPS
jgi:hypothetical protein